MYLHILHIRFGSSFFTTGKFEVLIDDYKPMQYIAVILYVKT